MAENYPNDRGVLKSAYQHGVPVFVPAFVDSELGNDIYIHNIKRRRRGKKPILMNLELDSKELIRVVTGPKRFGILSIGGGVPRNNVQNVAPLIEIINERLGPTFPNRKFSYGVRICPDKPHFGHLSGCTYSENESWRKADKNGIYAEMLADATQVWPFLVKYVMEKQSGRVARLGRRDIDKIFAAEYRLVRLHYQLRNLPPCIVLTGPLINLPGVRKEACP